MTDWQPIETAPKGGTRILVYAPRAVELGRDPIRIDEFRDGDWQHTNKHYWPATHWMPLPEAPLERENDT